MMFGVHMAIVPGKLSDVVKLRKQGRISCPKGMRIVEEYVWGLKFLIVIAESDGLKEITKFTEQFSEYICDLEVGAVTTLKNLAQE